MGSFGFRLDVGSPEFGPVVLPGLDSSVTAAWVVHAREESSPDQPRTHTDPPDSKGEEDEDANALEPISAGE